VYEITFDNNAGFAQGAYRVSLRNTLKLAKNWALAAMNDAEVDEATAFLVIQKLETMTKSKKVRVFYLPNGAGCITIEYLLLK
jgi:hypothetical protein